jgi:2'-5' RNA ligase
MNTLPKTHRLFFALWPSHQTRQSIIDSFSSLSRQTKGNLTLPGCLHMTLHFLGQVSDESKTCMHLTAQAIKAASFELALDRFGYFPKAKVVWLGPREKSAGLTELHEQLGRAITACGYQFESCSFTPHITLVRKCVKPEFSAADFSISWPVHEFVLVESITTATGVHYEVIEKYALS